MTEDSPPDSQDVTALPPTQRSRVSNGSALFVDGAIDHRTRWARRFRDLISDHVSDMGGPAEVSVAEQSLVRRAATLEVELERMEGEFAKSDQPNLKALESYQTMANTLRRILTSLGLERRQKGAFTLQDYMRQQIQQGQQQPDGETR